MKNLFENISEIKTQIEKRGGAFLMFDFDGVLSAIAPTPDEAFISDKNKALVKACAERFPVAVITGRELSEIKNKMKIEGLLYIASHGLEWEEGGEYHSKSIPKETIEAINFAKEKIRPLLSRYPGMIFEDKSFMFAVHYRIIKPELIGAFVKEVTSILGPIIEKNSLRLDHNLMTFELRPEIYWNKGDSALFTSDYFRKKTKKNFIPIYIGDSVTDEDAFRALKDGITIRVRSKEGSAAKYFFKSQKEVGKFLGWLVKIQPHS